MLNKRSPLVILVMNDLELIMLISAIRHIGYLCLYFHGIKNVTFWKLYNGEETLSKALLNVVEYILTFSQFRKDGPPCTHHTQSSQSVRQLHVVPATGL